MSFPELIRISFRALLNNRLRSLLTVLGIVIGVGAVVTLVSFGSSFQGYVTGQFQAIGSGLLIVSPSEANARVLTPKPLTLGDANAIANPSQVANLAAVAPVYGTSVTAKVGANSVNLQTTGTNEFYSVVRNYTVQDGRFLTAADVASSAQVVVLGSKTASDLFGSNTEPVGQQVRANGVVFTVIGVLQSLSGGFGNQDEAFIVPLPTLYQRLAGQAAQTSTGDYEVSTIFVKAIDDQSVEAVTSAIQSLLMIRHSIPYSGEEDFQVLAPAQIASTATNILGTLTIFLGLLAGISLLVGGIGVMNIMLVSVTERTREIGLRKAVGAHYRDLMLQFLIESVVLSILGGLLGIMLGFIAAGIGSGLLPTLNLTVSPSAIVLATGISTLIGVFFGIYPASRAASLSPIEALRTE
jgi:putative ABC transport system permease protein